MNRARNSHSTVTQIQSYYLSDCKMTILSLVSIDNQYPINGKVEWIFSTKWSENVLS